MAAKHIGKSIIAVGDFYHASPETHKQSQTKKNQLLLQKILTIKEERYETIG